MDTTSADEPADGGRPVEVDSPVGVDRNVGHRIRDRLRASDAGYERARGAARGLIAAGCGAGLAAAVLQLSRLDATPAMLAGVVGLLGSQTLHLIEADDHRRHVLRIAGTAAVSSALAAALSPYPLAGSIAFVTVMAAGALATRVGPSGTPVAMIAFMAQFLTMFLELEPSKIPSLVLASLAGGAGLAVSIFVLLPDRPAATLRRLVPALMSQASLVVDEAIAVVRDGIDDSGRDRLRRRLHALQEVALRLDSILEASSKRWLVADSDRLRNDVLTTEMLCDHLVFTVLTSAARASEPDRQVTADALTRARAPLDGAGRPGRPTVAVFVPHLDAPDGRVIEIVERLAAVVAGLGGSSGRSGGAEEAYTDDPDGVSANNEEEKSEPADDARPATGGLRERPEVRKAVQVTLAGSIAMVLGQQISSTRWYWAVLGAFLVVMTTPSRGAGIRKAVDRTIGTAIGVAGGLVLVTVVSGHRIVEILGMVVLAFAAFWVVPVSYTAMILLITVMIAFLYDLTGTFTTDLLMIRLWETALGTAVGGAVAFFVLPISTRHTINQAVDDLLGTLDELLEELRAGSRDLVPQLRMLDRSVSALRLTTRPLVATARGALRDHIVDARLLASAVRFHAHALIAAGGGAPGLAISPSDHVSVPEEETAAVADHVRHYVASLRTALSTGTPPSAHAIDRFTNRGGELAGQAGGQGPVVLVMRALGDRLAAFAEARNLDTSGRD